MKNLIKSIVFYILNVSLNLASFEQGLRGLKRELAKIVPDLTDQYSSFQVKGAYLFNKMRSQHAFQIRLALDAISFLNKGGEEVVNIVDIGDSSGTHLAYLTKIAEGKVSASSVNLDPVAIDKIRRKGFDATLSRAELLHEHPEFNKKADIFLSYEMIEHLLDPVSFLHNMATKSECDFFVVTVPYVWRSRVGLPQVRGLLLDRPFNAETTHVFELSPEDWNLIFKFSGWKIVKQVRYTQYPKYNPMTVSRYLWRKLDFDGVIKDSMEVKSDAFAMIFSDFGEEVSSKVRRHHEANGGMSRYKKIPLYLSWAGLSPSNSLIKRYIEQFYRLVKQQVIDCEWVAGVEEFIYAYNNKIKMFVVTATPQSEIEEIGFKGD